MGAVPLATVLVVVSPGLNGSFNTKAERLGVSYVTELSTRVTLPTLMLVARPTDRARAEGVGRSTAQAVVITSVAILVLDALTALLLAPYLQA